uniref:Integrin alpha second immunoglobulin-like domain-containing protein n=1 Tax=Timema bartmani TaxID=61472 RepID=A0A7R9HZS8_9NEOP|nr:unnamed protein product [Timema bartmani]
MRKVEYVATEALAVKSSNTTYSSPMTSLVLTDSSQLTVDGFEKLPEQIMVLVGAPRGNSSIGNQRNIAEPGLVFTCSLEKPYRRCEEQELDPTGNERSPPYGSIYFDHKDGAWIGGSMDIQTPENGGRVSVCGHRWINDFNQDYLMIGVCYVLPPDSSTVVDKLLPLVEPGYQVNSGRFFGKDVLYYVSSAPRAACYKGMVIVFKMTSNGMTFKTKKEGTVIGEYFGASLAVADITNDGLDDLIVGAPIFSKHYEEGRIYIFHGSTKGEFNNPIVGETIDGYSPGGRFGSAIASLGDLDQDGFDDIVVGAPYEKDRGAIYIYNGRPLGLTPKYSQRILAEEVHPVLRGFGISFSRPTDIDDNKYNDVAVGSFLSGHAVLLRSRPVISLGMSLTSTTTKLQREDQSFNVSVCVWYKGVNILVDKVGVVQGGVNILVDKVGVVQGGQQRGCSTRGVNILVDKVGECVCRCSTRGVNILVDKVDVTRTLIIDRNFKRGYVSSPDKILDKFAVYVKKISVGKMISCENITVHLDQTKTHRSLDAFEMAMNCTLSYIEVPVSPIIVSSTVQGEDHFDRKLPVLHRHYGEREESLTVPYAFDCGEDDVCHSDLSLVCELVGVGMNGAAYVIGSSDSLELVIHVTNKEEPAYVTEVTVILLRPLQLTNLLARCHETRNVSTTVTCRLDDPLRASNKHSELRLTLDTRDVTNTIQNLHINVTVSTKSVETKLDDNSQNLIVPLLTEADITITGTSQDVEYNYFKKQSDSTVFIFHHIYEVQKYGKSPIEEVEVEFLIPLFYKEDGKKDTKILKIYQPKGYQYDTELIYNSDIKFDKEESSPDVSSFSDVDSLVAERTKRWTQDYQGISHTIVANNEGANKGTDSSQCVDLQNVETNLPPSNRTFFLNCSSSYVKYASIKFKTERLTWTQTSARFILRLELDLAKLEKFMEMKDIVYLSTQGHVKITQPDNYNSSMNTRPDLVQVSTMFRINEPRKVAKYIIALSIIAGILLILFIVTGLIKTAEDGEIEVQISAGFFKREKKEELKQLMSTEAADEFNYRETMAEHKGATKYDVQESDDEVN